MTVLDIPILSQLRRNHGLEHATLAVLARRFPRLPLAGFSFPGGFFILGNVSTETLSKAVMAALERLRRGEKHLAVHPNCGTNLAAAAFIAGLLTWLGMIGAKTKRDKVERLPLLFNLAALGFILGQPLGMKIQEKITTSGEPKELAVVEIFPIQFGNLRIHRVVTQG